ncbi:calpain-5-like [Littorina saxatilis]|uniref:C2 domain-containing protein n=1 Tax=Littorina saxatilis TaxID=31220 RepID=A0AAN9FY15_9CAEN
MVTHIKVIKAVGLQKLDKNGGADPFCVIICEGEKVKGRVEKSSVNPEWGDSALFYRKNLAKPIIIQVWNSNLFRDELMGQHTFKSVKEMKQQASQVVLYGKDKESDTVKPGELQLSVTQSVDLYAV